MPIFFVDDANFEATVDHLLKHGRFNEQPTREKVEDVLKKQLNRLYPVTLQSDPAALCECVYQSVFCMPCRSHENGPDAYLLNLVCRLRSSDVLGSTKI